jgi:hypothetical protein
LRPVEIRTRSECCRVRRSSGSPVRRARACSAVLLQPFDIVAQTQDFDAVAQRRFGHDWRIQCRLFGWLVLDVLLVVARGELLAPLRFDGREPARFLGIPLVSCLFQRDLPLSP